MTGKGISCKTVFFTVPLVQYALESHQTQIYKQTCNVAFFSNNFNQILLIDITVIAGCSLVAPSFEREDVRMGPFANLTCDY